MKEILDKYSSDEILQAANLVKQASIFKGGTERPFAVQVMTLDLSTAQLETQPKKIGFPFKSVYAANATDTTVNINLKINSQDSYQSAIPIFQNDSLTMDYPISEAYIHWAAQAAKTIVLVFFVDAEFRSGKQISVTGGGVSIVDGSSIALGAAVTLVAATAALIAPALSTRKKATIQNKTGADIYIGDSTITNAGATEGIKIPNDGIIYWQNTGGLYGYSVAGGKVSRTEET
jgi:hypothetical protein